MKFRVVIKYGMSFLILSMNSRNIQCVVDSALSHLGIKDIKSECFV